MNICCLFDCIWVEKGSKWKDANESRFEFRVLSIHITRTKLFIDMYEAFCVDDSLYNLKLEAAYVWVGRLMSPLILASDTSVTAFMLENCGHSKLRILLCVDPMKRNIVDASLGPSPSRANVREFCVGLNFRVFFFYVL